MSVHTTKLLDGEKADLIEEAKAVLGDYADTWLDVSNPQLGGARPRELIMSSDETKRQFVRDLLRAIRHGMPT